MFAKIDKAPLLVKVTQGHWDAYGDPLNPRHFYLMEVLKRMGGIAESVPYGEYDFNLARKGLSLHATLEPHQED